MSRYILYAVHGERNSDKALSCVVWGPDNLTLDKEIMCRNPFHLRSNLPLWLNGVPILADVQKHHVYKGSHCLRELQQAYTVTKVPGMGDEVPIPPSNLDDLDQNIDIPPDPRDVAQTHTDDIRTGSSSLSTSPSPNPIPIPIPIPTPVSSSLRAPSQTRVPSSASSPLAALPTQSFSFSPETLEISAPTTISS